MPNINLKGKVSQRIKYTDIVTIERIGKKKQRKTIERQTEGVKLVVGSNDITDEEYQKIEKSPWFVLLVGRKDIVVTGVSEKKPVEKKTVPKKGKKVVTVKRNN